MQRDSNTRRKRWVQWALWGSIGLIMGFANPLQAADSLKESSIKFAPIDADLYGGSYQLAEQWSRIAKGPVVAKLMAVEGIKDAIENFKEQWAEREGYAGQARFYFENPNVQNALTFAKDLSSNDVFYFADKHLSQLYLTSAKLNDEVLNKIRSGELTAEEVPEMAQEFLTKFFQEVSCPTMVFGAKFSDEDAALTKLDELEGVLRLGVGSIPQAAPLMDSLDRVEDSRGSRLQWKLSGSQIPWDMIPTNESFDDEAKESIRDLLSEKSVTITIGILDSYFIIALSPDAATINKLGSQKSLLDNPHLGMLAKASGPLTSVAYVSDSFAKASYETSLKNFFTKNVSINVGQAFQWIDKASDAKEFLDKIRDDMEWLDESIAKLVPPFLGSTSYAFMTDSGWERHDFFRTKDVILDGKSKLDALNHVGGDPLLMVTTRMQDHPEYFQLCRTIAKRIKSRLDDMTTMDLSEIGFGSQEKNQLQEGLSQVWPMLVKIADTWETKFLPSFNGEHAIVITGGKLAAKQWTKEMPMSDEPLPMPEIASVTGLKNWELYKSGWSDLFGMCDDIVASVRKAQPDAIPANYSIPRPTRDTASGQLEKYSYPIPSDCPVPKEMAPQGVYAGNYFVASMSSTQSASLINSKGLAIGKNVIDPNKPLKSASYVHVGKMIEFMRPWVRYALQNGLEDLDETIPMGSGDEEDAPISLTGRDILGIWDALGQIGDFSSVTTGTESGGTMVRSVYQSRK